VARLSSEGLGVAHDLLGVLVEGDHQAVPLVCGPFQQQLHAQDRLAHARDPHHHRDGAVKDASAEELVERGGADDRLPGTKSVHMRLGHSAGSSQGIFLG
jgi:hypothetical protein